MSVNALVTLFLVLEFLTTLRCESTAASLALFFADIDNPSLIPLSAIRSFFLTVIQIMTGVCLVRKDAGISITLLLNQRTRSTQQQVADDIVQRFVAFASLAHVTDEALKTWASVKVFGGVVPGSKVHKGEALFPRIDVAKELELLEAEKQAALDHAKEMAEKDAKQNELPAPADEEKTVFTQRDLIQFEDFEKVQLVVAKVLKCEKVPKADKLLMSTLKVGDTERVVVSGIAKFYTPEEMVGKKVVLLANLAPRKIRGVESHGMLLCAANADDSKLSLLTVDSDMEDGCEIG